jgi:hypothetical protein
MYEYIPLNYRAEYIPLNYERKARKWSIFIGDVIYTHFSWINALDWNFGQLNIIEIMLLTFIAIFTNTLVYTAISIKVVPLAKRKSRIRARKAAGNR